MTRATQFSCDPAEFAGKRALVAGATKGMGEAIVRGLAAIGARVATTARTPLPGVSAGQPRFMGANTRSTAACPRSDDHTSPVRQTGLRTKAAFAELK